MTGYLCPFFIIYGPFYCFMWSQLFAFVSFIKLWCPSIFLGCFVWCPSLFLGCFVWCLFHTFSTSCCFCVLFFIVQKAGTFIPQVVLFSVYRLLPPAQQPYIFCIVFRCERFLWEGNDGRGARTMALMVSSSHSRLQQEPRGGQHSLLPLSLVIF